jgi:uncharacterized protein (DUF433 family)
MVAVPINYLSIDERGVAYIAGTRMKVRQIAQETLQGSNPREILEAHPHLSLSQIHAALAYYYDHQAEMDAEIEAAERQADEILAKIGRPLNRDELRKRAHRRP